MQSEWARNAQESRDLESRARNAQESRGLCGEPNEEGSVMVGTILACSRAASLAENRRGLVLCLGVHSAPAPAPKSGESTAATAAPPALLIAGAVVAATGTRVE